MSYLEQKEEIKRLKKQVMDLQNDLADKHAAMNALDDSHCIYQHSVESELAAVTFELEQAREEIDGLRADISKRIIREQKAAQRVDFALHGLKERP